MVVIDASAVAEILLRTTRGREVSNQLLREGSEIWTPHLLDLEVLQVLRRHTRRGALTAEEARAAVADLAEFPVRRHRHDLLLERVWSLRENATAYDATYLALAEALDAPLLTCDRALARVPGVAAEVRVI